MNFLEDEMAYEPISIYFQTQLRFLPVEELRFGKNFVRDLFGKLAEPGGYPYENLSLQSNPPTMSTQKTTPRGDGESSCRIRPDSITIEETDPDIHLESFKEIVRTVLQAASEVKQGTAPIFLQKCLFRCLVKPKSANSILLLAGKVSNVLEAINPFERPPLYFGIRFRFPPFEMETEESDGGGAEEEKRHDFVSVRFETWTKDVDMVWIEVDSNYLFPEAIDMKAIDRIEQNITETYSFLTEKCINFLAQFDEKPDPKLDDDEEDGEDEEEQEE